MSSKYSDVKLHINGKWRDAIAGETLDVINPATEDVIGNVAHARSSDLDEALEAMRSEFGHTKSPRTIIHAPIWPFLPSGKVDRRHLAEVAAEFLAATI